MSRLAASGPLFWHGRLLLLLAGFFLVSDIGIFSSYDGAAYVLASAVLMPEMLPMLLVAVASVQDVRGLNLEASYLALVAGGLAWMAREFYHWKKGAVRILTISSRLRHLAIAAIAVIAYGWLITLIYMWAGGPAQSHAPTMKAGSMGFMLVIGLLVALGINSTEKRQSILLAVWLSLWHMLMVAFIQLHLGNEILVPQYVQEFVQNKDQLTALTGMGYPRIIGTWTSPNAFGLCVGLLLLIALALEKPSKSGVSPIFILLYCLIGGVLVLLSLSKALAIYFMLTAGVLLLQSDIWKRFLSIFLFAGLVAAVLFAAGHLDGVVLTIQQALRVEEGVSVDSMRSKAWLLLIDRMSISDWFFGTGLNHWRNFFMSEGGFTLSDPHSYILTVPGTYGLLGVVLYGMLATILIKQARASGATIKAAAVMFLILFFIKDAVSIPYLLGNTANTFLIWLGLGLVLSGNMVAGQIHEKKTGRDTEVVSLQKSTGPE